MNKEVTTILEYSKSILTGAKQHNFLEKLGRNFSERSIETPWVASIIKKYNIQSILDIGFTMSSLDYLGLLLELKKNYGILIEVNDIIRPERVKKRYPEEWLEDIFSIPVTIGDIREFSGKENKYDAITCISTIEHIGFDKASLNDLKTAFDREFNPGDVGLSRPKDTNQIVLDKLHSILKTAGKLLISAPVGKGGPVILKDSLNYYTAEWEYEKNSWYEIVNHSKFKLLEESFFKFTDEGFWIRVDDITQLSKQNSTLKEHAQGCGLALLEKL